MEADKIYREWNQKFLQILGIEFANPDYFKFHHLLVLTFMIQTDYYSNKYIPDAINLLRRFTSGESPQKILAEIKNSRILDFKAKGSGIRKVEEERRIDTYAWKNTIMDIRVDSADNYCRDIFLWAKDVLLIVEEFK